MSGKLPRSCGLQERLGVAHETSHMVRCMFEFSNSSQKAVENLWEPV